MTSSREHHVRELRRNRLKLLASASTAIVFCAIGLAFVAAGMWAWGLFHLAFPLTITRQLLTRTWMDNADPKVIPRRVVMARDRIRIDDRHIPRSAVETAYVLPRAHPKMLPTVRIHVAGRPPIDLMLDSPSAVEPFFDDLGLDVHQRTVTFTAMVSPLVCKSHRIIAGMIAAAILAAVTFYAVTQPERAFETAPLLWCVPLGLSVILGPKLRSVHVGADGLRIERVYRRDLFVPHADLEEIRLEPSPAGCVAYVRKRGEPELRLSFNDLRTAQVLVARVRAAAQASESGGRPLVTALSRAGRTTPEWVRRLRSLTALGSHRTNAVSLDQLWTIVERSAEPLQRAAAAIALAGELDEPSRKRITVAAAATASPRLRVLLGEVERGADAESLVIALEAVAEEEATRQAEDARR